MARSKARHEEDGDEGPETCVPLKLDLLEGDQEGWAERLDDSDGEVEGPVEG